MSEAERLMQFALEICNGDGRKASSLLCAAAAASAYLVGIERELFVETAGECYVMTKNALDRQLKPEVH